MNNNRKPNAKVLLVGKSGSGKNTVQDYLVRKYGLKPLLSYTTRDRRFPEENTHTFITLQEYEGFKQTDFIAYTFYNGNHYTASCSGNKFFIIIKIVIQIQCYNITNR